MTTFVVTSSSDVVPAVNYLLSNMDTGTGNVVLPANVLVGNTTTGIISQYGNITPIGYIYQYINLRYSNNATGTAGFDVNSNNFSYFGVFNSVSSSPSTNPSAYSWYEVSPPFDTATSRTLYYSAIGGRQIQWAAASAPPNPNFQITVANVAIDLDVVTTAAGTPGERGPATQASVITTADPNTASQATLTTWFEASRDAVSPPIGTGLTPVVGDTATFTWAAGPGQPNVTLSYNGSIWIPVTGQVVNGNVIIAGTLAGNTITANTITATQIATGTITANQIAANTITATQIAANTITANQIAANTITSAQIQANTITANRIATGTITATQIATGTLTTNLFTANSINANIITANTFAANTINGQAITASSITTDKLAANVLTANTVVSTGATIGNFNSPGFWLQGNTGNARFGNTVSIGNQLIVGNNASIGGNLAISGLVTGGILDANTVSTTAVVPQAITTVDGASVGQVTITANALPGITYVYPGATVTTTQANQEVIVFWDAGFIARFRRISASATAYGVLRFKLYRYPIGDPGSGIEVLGVTKNFQQTMPSAGVDYDVIYYNQGLPTAIDSPASPGTYVYGWGASVTYTFILGTWNLRYLTTTLTSDSGASGLNSIVALGTKR